MSPISYTHETGVEVVIDNGPVRLPAELLTRVKHLKSVRAAVDKASSEVEVAILKLRPLQMHFQMMQATLDEEAALFWRDFAKLIGEETFIANRECFKLDPDMGVLVYDDGLGGGRDS